MDAITLEMKHKRISYYQKQGRISNEEYEKWILSEDGNYEPKIMSAEEYEEKFKLDWGQFHNQHPLIWTADPHKKTHKLLEEISKTLIRIEEKLNRTL